MNRFSVIMTVFDNGKDLEENLPAYLTQAYEPGYEVIVVDESSTDHTDDVLKLMKQQYPHLYTTFLPKPDIHLVRKRLALTIGVKAAKNEWIIFSDINAFPEDNAWLQTIADNLGNASGIMLARYRKGELIMHNFERLEEVSNYVIKGERQRADGHRGSRLRKLRGKYDFIVVRADEAHELLKLFEQHVGFARLLGLRLSIFFRNLF
ncbi:MAG: glycosyltransferase [Prevotella sp.]|nr:glycosyltransferase [Prevotella sp.]